MKAYYAVMGDPVEHSRSPELHTAFAKQLGVDLSYERILVKSGQLKSAVKDFIKQGGKGLSITVPLKGEAFQLVHERSQGATLAGAVSVIKIEENGRLYGENLDGPGLVNDIQNNLTYPIKDKKVLLIGAGGGARGIAGPILQCKPQDLIIANRTKATAIQLAEHFHEYGKVAGCGFEDLIDWQFDLVINATSSSVQGIQLPLPARIFAANSLCYDIMYGPKTQGFLQWAKDNGADQASDGFGMLLEQAALSFELWQGKLPTTQPLFERK